MCHPLQTPLLTHLKDLWLHLSVSRPGRIPVFPAHRTLSQARKRARFRWDRVRQKRSTGSGRCKERWAPPRASAELPKRSTAGEGHKGTLRIPRAALSTLQTAPTAPTHACGPGSDEPPGAGGGSGSRSCPRSRSRRGSARPQPRHRRTGRPWGQGGSQGGAEHWAHPCGASGPPSPGSGTARPRRRHLGTPAILPPRLPSPPGRTSPGSPQSPLLPPPPPFEPPRPPCPGPPVSARWARRDEAAPEEALPGLALGAEAHPGLHGPAPEPARVTSASRCHWLSLPRPLPPKQSPGTGGSRDPRLQICGGDSLWFLLPLIASLDQ